MEQFTFYSTFCRKLKTSEIFKTQYLCKEMWMKNIKIGCLKQFLFKNQSKRYYSSATLIRKCKKSFLSFIIIIFVSQSNRLVHICIYYSLMMRWSIIRHKVLPICLSQFKLIALSVEEMNECWVKRWVHIIRSNSTKDVPSCS